MAYAKEKRERLGRIGTQLQGIIDSAEKANRGLTSAERESFAKLEKDYSALQDEVRCLERANEITNSLRTGPGGSVNELGLEEMRDTMRSTPRRNRDKPPADRAFSNYLRRGMEALDADERSYLQLVPGSFQNAQQGTGGAAGGYGSQGGYLIPQGFSDQLEEAKKWFGGIDGVVGKFQTETGAPLPWPTINDTTNRGRIIGQNVQVTETDLAFSQVTFQSYIGCSDTVLVPLALIQDAYFDLDALVARLLGTRLGRLYNWKCTLGTGTNEPTGIVTAAVAAGGTYTFANGQGAVTGIGSGGATAYGYNNLLAVEHTVDPAYRFNPSTHWMLPDAQLKNIKALLDAQGRPLWQPGLTASFRDGAAIDLIAAKPTILDHPYVINQDMATPAAGSYSLLFGDMNCFKVREVAGGTSVMRLVERYADYLQVGFICWTRFDSQLVDAGTHPVAVGIQAAS